MNTLSRRHLLQAVLAAGCAPAWARHAMAADLDRFGFGLASGFPHPNGMVLWTMLTGPDLPAQVAVDWELADDEGFQRIVASGREWAMPADSYSVHAEPQGLASDRWYWYRFTALGQQSIVGRTRTAPAFDAPVARLRFALASCQRYDHGRYAAWADCAQREHDVVFFVGDYIYENGAIARPAGQRSHSGPRCQTLADYRARHALYRADPLLQAAHARTPWIIIWDDHDIENDWAGNVSEHLTEHFERQRAFAAKAYWEFLPFPKSRRPDAYNMLIHERHDWGRLARFITLDDRQYRDAQVCPKPGEGGGGTVNSKDCPAVLDRSRTLLGAAQEQWLAAQWDDNRPWNLLAQQTMMAGLNWEKDPALPEVRWTDGWDGYVGSRERVLAGLAARHVPNAVVLGGDVHANYVCDLRERPDAPIVASEFCGTSITSEGLKQERLDKALPYNPHIHYGRSDERGYMSFELRPGLLSAELRRVDDIWKADSSVSTAARFVVEAGKAGPQKA
ncbi:alkaline phosphatase D family protein [Burkholderiaceae bacterium UC74_6]